MIHTRHLGLVEETNVFAQHGAQCEGEDDDADASLPLYDGAPEEDPLGEVLHGGKGRGTRSGKARDRLKERTAKAGQVTPHEKRNHTNQCHHQPRHRYGEHSLTATELVTILESSEPEAAEPD